MIKLKKLMGEGTKPPSPMHNEARRHFLEVISTYKAFGRKLQAEHDLAEIANTLGGIVDAATTFAVKESGNNFDPATVKRNMGDLGKLSAQFEKSALEAKQLQQRMSSLYEDMGHVLGRYFDMQEISDEDADFRLGKRPPKMESSKLSALMPQQQNEEQGPCWKGYKQIGMKDKGGSQVPNCVPKNESVNENILNEDLDALGLLIPALGALIGGGLAQLYPYFTGRPNIYTNIKDWWKSKKDNSEMNKIANRIKNDPDVQEFLKKKNKSGWKEMLKKKLTGSELNYLNKIYRSRFNNESVVKESKSDCGCNEQHDCGCGGHHKH